MANTIKKVAEKDFDKLSAKALKIRAAAEKRVEKLYADYLIKNYANRRFRVLPEFGCEPDLVLVTLADNGFGTTVAVLVDPVEKKEYRRQLNALFELYEVVD